MPPPPNANPFARRLPGIATERDLNRMAWAPSYRAPRLRDVQNLSASPLPQVMGKERELLDAILDAIDAAEPRRAYADYIGGERGAFIRRELEGNAHAIVPACASLPFAAWEARDLIFRNGFAEAMSMAGRCFISRGAELMRFTPLRELRLVAIAPFMGELANCQHLSRIESLNLWGNHIEAEGVRHLVKSPFLMRLRHLDLRRNSLDAEAIRELQTAPWYAQLEKIDLAENAYS
jgi:hypothetical protein